MGGVFYGKDLKMATVYPLYSSSSGNCTYIGDSQSGILIDCGVSCKKTLEALAMHGIPITAIRAICVTHTHDDHIKGLKVLTKKCPVKIIAQSDNLLMLANKQLISPYCELCPIEDGETISLDDTEISAFETMHDTPANCGFTFTLKDGKRAAVCTDLGIVTETVRSALMGVDMALIEANYDKAMLFNGAYPESLKRRISSEHGHLSNDDSGELAKFLLEGGATKLCLGHLSEHNNTPQKAESTVVAALGDAKRNSDYMLDVATKDFSGLAVVF